MKKLLIATGIIIITAFIAVLIITQAIKEPEQIKIGVILPLTGNMAAFGEFQQKALLLAEENINQENVIDGKKVKFIFEDSKGAATDAVSAVYKLIGVDNVNIIFAFKGSLVEAIQPITDEKKVLLFAFAMDPGISRSSYTFRIYPNLDLQSSIMLDYIKDSDFQRVAIFYVLTPATQVLVPQLLIPGVEKMGKTVVSAESFEEQERDVRTQALKIKNSNPDLIITLAHFVFIPNMLTTLKELGVLDKVSVLGGLDYSFPIQVDKSLLEGIDYVAPAYSMKVFNKDNESWFEKTFKARYGNYPGYDPSFFFDSAMILANGLKSYGTDVELIKRYLTSIKNYQGVTGQISIDNSRDAIVEMKIGTIRGGQREIKKE